MSATAGVFDMCSLSWMVGKTLKGWGKGRWRKIGTVREVNAEQVIIVRAPYNGKPQGEYSETIPDMRRFIDRGMLKTTGATS